jgi:2-(1,2-epoxy-1,2-dihydrophenyl)acetyl-CoA isomerase
MADATVLSRRDGNVLVVTLNRPEVLNALNAELTTELRRVLQAAEADASCRCLLLTGAGRGFSAGADIVSSKLRDRAHADSGLIDKILEERFHPIVRLLRDSRVPVVCAVNGVAADAGMSLALACDMVIAARSAKFIQSFAHLGLVQDAGSSFYLPRLIGKARAWGLALTGDELPAATAAEWGLIWRCVEDGVLMDEALALAQRLAAMPTRGLALMRAVMHRGLENGLEEQLRLEACKQVEATRTADFREAIDAFAQKRKPAFKGN